jgi:carbonic anhydrase
VLRSDCRSAHYLFSGHLMSVSNTGELKAKAVADPRTAVAVDVDALRAVPALPGQWLISGLVYDVASGLIEISVPPAPIRNA